MISMGEAARLAGVSKTSIRRSIDAGRLSATKDDFGRWRIDPAELQRVYPSTAAPAAQSVTPEVTLLREALDREREIARALEAERDAWRQQADAWRLQATAPLPPPRAEVRQPWWRRLFR